MAGYQSLNQVIMRAVDTPWLGNVEEIFPLGQLSVVVGAPVSGKSTFLIETACKLGEVGGKIINNCSN